MYNNKKTTSILNCTSFSTKIIKPGKKKIKALKVKVITSVKVKLSVTTEMEVIYMYLALAGRDWLCKVWKEA